ncbi:cobyrinate a,c-diamide synthase [Peptostreptococcus equinus]|uniref:Cobyrinate a,c-diamide synthase n=1 Tax=Peptostreptococcus equinus TaxID=3003601 RepID=A0ABY7JSY0_9FIRM|nr:cobyrinate a,c-diamide synthase [Peptostreptococcus sp. CBA3647]WAW15090.1 cobyrinate a,c-diamide synthase [Peptostreptococcus sp. CBA3647]
MKKIIIAGTNSGVGKTTISLGLMKALMNRNKKVQAFKVGPDYIDPSYHRYVTGNYSRNLDTHMLDSEQIKYVFTNAVKDKDISVIEGVMGLYDGTGSDIHNGSTASLAKILKAPVILIINGKSISASAAAMVLGYKHLDKDVDLVGVIVNNVKTEKHYNTIKSSIEKYCNVEVLGYLPPDDSLKFGSRHLGLLPTSDDIDLDEKIEKISQMLEKYVDIDRIVELSESETISSSFEMDMFLEDPEVRELSEGKKIAIAYDEAFNFYYQDNIELFRKLGADIVYFSPMHDNYVPAADLVYIGGGYPEVYAKELEKNVSMRKSLKEYHEAGNAIYAECGGLMYLGDYYEDSEGEKFDMVGAISGHSRMTNRLVHFGYCIATSKEDNLIAYKNQQICGHKFHYSEFISDLEPAFVMEKYSDGKVIDTWESGYYEKNTLATYLHIHFYNNLSIICYLLSGANKRI